MTARAKKPAPPAANPPPDDKELSPDAKAAHQLLTELRTRISTQPLPYQYGVEERALTSLFEVFGHTREAIRANPGCERFAARATEVLNVVLRPMTAKWHRALEEHRLASHDGADAFRGELRTLQTQLRTFARELHRMAYGTDAEDALTPNVMTPDALAKLAEPLAFGFRATTPLAAEKADRIQADEAASVAQRRTHFGVATAPGTDAVGLALSGGGIRSASFSLGVVQVLAERGLLGQVDFLSTVSGGGYTGSFLTRRLGNGEPHDQVAAPRGPDPEPIRYLRQNTRYLSGNNLKERWSMVCATLAGMLLNWTTPLLVMAVLALVATFVGPVFSPHRWGLVKFFAALTLIAVGGYGWGMRGGKDTSSATGGLLAWLLAATLAIGAAALLHDLRYLWLPDWWHHHHPRPLSATLALLVGSTATITPAIVRIVPVAMNPKWRQLLLKIALALAGLAVPCGAVVLFYVLLDLGQHHPWLLLLAAVALGAVSFYVVDINLTGPHRLYRDCLARTFIQKTAGGSPHVLLADINQANTAPYHLINATLNVPASETAALKDRGCDFFTFSKHWTGSASTGYEPTEKWRTNAQGVDLATAMAVSGAAFSAHMGLGSMPTLTALLTLLNVRLGFWIKRPGTPPGNPLPGFWCLLRETLGVAMTEKSNWINLSDGGHIENMAVYELLRRRCKFIVCVDGESDPTFTFQGLMTLTRHARIDFGVNIEPVLDDLRQDARTLQSRSHFHLRRILYPEGVGLLLYIKLSITGDESEMIRRYRTNHPEFPHQTTLDQFFDQEQFESYRQLGSHAAEALFKPVLMDGKTPATISAWFEQLAKNLLEP